MPWWTVGKCAVFALGAGLAFVLTGKEDRLLRYVGAALWLALGWFAARPWQ